jgi:predicted AlkP superfamily phosphohydrolase/phosphomutase/Flp pilus assembly protein TadD
MSKRLTQRVLLIGWDAADWQIIHQLLEGGKMPVLQKLIECGISGKIATLQPIISPILWNSIATGKRADKHDILGFVEPSPDGNGIRLVSSTSRKAKAIWNILSQSGLRSGVVNWYASYPAEPIEGAIFTNRFTTMPWEKEKMVPVDSRAVHPPEMIEVANRFRTHPRDITPAQLLPFFPNSKPTDPADPRPAMLAKILAECSTTQNAATYLAARDDWDFLAVYYDAIDHAGHGFIEYHPPAMSHVSTEDAAIYGDVVTCMYRFHDMLLGRLLDLVGPETTVLLISDHGFYSDHLRPQVTEHFRDPEKKFGPEMNPVAWHRPHGVLIGAGKPIKRDELIHGTTLLDIAPTVLALLGLPVPEDMDGRVLTHMFAEPIEIDRIPSYEAVHPKDGVHRKMSVEESDPWAARQALDQLAALGYINLPEESDPKKKIAEVSWDRRSNLAQVYFSTGRTRKALEILQEMLAERDQPHLRCRIALCLIALGRPLEAEEVVTSVALAADKTPLAALILGQAKLAQNQTEEALALLEPLQKEAFPLSHLHSVLGQAYLRRGLLAEAEAAFRHALERDDDNAEAHDGLGVVLRRLRRHEDAVYEHTRAASLQHHRPQTHLNLGIALAMSQQFDWAIRAFTIAAELAPNMPLPHRWLSAIYRRVKNDKAKAGEHARLYSNLRRRALEKVSTKRSVPRK